LIVVSGRKGKSGFKTTSPGTRTVGGLGPIVGIVALGIAVTVLAFVMAKRSDDQRVQSELASRALLRAHAFERRLVLTQGSLEAMAVFIASEKAIDAASFHRFAHLDYDSDDTNSALLWAPLVRGPDRKAFAAAQPSGAAGAFEIEERKPDGSLVRAAERDEYLPTLFEETYDGSPGLAGFDLLTLPERRARAERARDEGTPIATPPVSILLGGVQRLGFLVFWPVYSTGDVPATVEARRAAYRGAAISRLDFARVLPTLIASSPGIEENIEFLIDRGRDGGRPQQVGTYDGGTGKITLGEASIAGAAGGVPVTREFDIFGQHWTIRFVFPPVMVAGLRSGAPWAWLVFGLALTSLTAAYFQRQRSRRWGIETIVAERTAELSREVEDRRRQEQAAREIATRLQAVVDTTVHGVVIIDGQGSISMFNPAAERLFGYHAAELIGQNVKMLMPPPFQEEHDGYLDNYRRTGERKIIGIGREVVGRRKDGTTFPMDLAVGEARQNGAPLFVGVIVDLTERKRTEDALRLWGDAFEKAAFGIAITDAKTGMPRQINTAMARMHGMTVEEMQRVHVRDGYPAAELDRLTAMNTTLKDTGHVAFEALRRRKDGSVFPAQVDITGVRDEAGKVLYMIASAFDVTERRQAEDNLRASEERFRSIFSAVGDGIFLTSATTGTFVAVNDPGDKMFGYEPGELIGSTIETISSGEPPYTQPDALAWIEKARATGRPQTFDWNCKTKDGRHFWVEISLRFAMIGGLDFVLAIVRDQTAQHAIEHQLRQAQKMEAIGNLSGGMAHDFNNLLGVVIGNLDLLRELLPSKSEALELADESLAAALRGAELTRRLLAFARRQPLAPQRIALNDLVANIVKLLQRTLGEQIEIALDLAAFVWPVVVDPAQLEAAIANLATNARDAMPRGGKLTIATANRRLDDDYAALHADVTVGDYALIEVSDIGTGMTPEVMAKIFEPFYTTKAEGKGTGLGLSMVFGFIKQSGGHITVYSEPGAGTTFRLYLPRSLEGAFAEEMEPRADVPRAGGESVLAVEDNAALRRVVVRQLTDLGYRVVEADGAAAALALMEREKIDLLFSDVVMPGDMDGYALAQRVAERWPRVKIVLTSGFPETNVSETFGAVAPTIRLLSKPYRRDELARAIREALDR